MAYRNKHAAAWIAAMIDAEPSVSNRRLADDLGLSHDYVKRLAPVMRARLGAPKPPRTRTETRVALPFRTRQRLRRISDELREIIGETV